jgi:hypothetical protein
MSGDQARVPKSDRHDGDAFLGRALEVEKRDAVGSSGMLLEPGLDFSVRGLTALAIFLRKAQGLKSILFSCGALGIGSLSEFVGTVGGEVIAEVFKGRVPGLDAFL